MVKQRVSPIAIVGERNVDEVAWRDTRGLDYTPLFTEVARLAPGKCLEIEIPPGKKPRVFSTALGAKWNQSGYREAHGRLRKTTHPEGHRIFLMVDRSERAKKGAKK